MLNNHVKIMHFFKLAKEITGRKKLQKMIYILQTCGVPFEEKYQFHFYGPYSEGLSLRMEELANLGFLEEQKEDKSNYIQYHYKITAAGETFLRQFPLDMPDFSKQVALLQGKSSRFLELAATMLYFEPLPEAEVEAKVNQVKPKQKYTKDEMAAARELIKELRASLVQ